MSKPGIRVTISPPPNPKTDAEWQVVVDVAEALLQIHRARLDGRRRHGPEVDVARCEELLELGRQRGVTPRTDAVERYSTFPGRLLELREDEEDGD